jgi:demethylmenaquinone methyltransferase/2-methoxy-6-polyprenyl-1,4-benzoquinol methylase
MKTPNKKKENVSEMFNNIAEKYDFLNHFLSAGTDKRWRKYVRKQLKDLKNAEILDVACGTGDLAIELAKNNPLKIIGIDIAEKMIEIGNKKIKKLGLHDKIELLKADALKIPFDNDKFDAVTCAFGVRNFENLEIGLKEMKRVLKPGGKLIILEFSQPKSKIIKKSFKFYFHRLLPFIGEKISKNKEAYKYLPQTVETFPFGADFKQILDNQGFSNTSFKELSFGIATAYTANKISTK